MKRAAIFSILALVLGLLALGPIPSAGADGASVPFFGSKLLEKKCNNPGSYRKIRTVKRAPRTSDTRSWQFVDSNESGTGHLKTNVYVKNSYRNYDVGIVCNGARDKYRTTTPITYVHRTRYVNLNCYGMSCRHLYTTTSGWVKGYCMRGSDGKVCSFD